MVSKVFLMTCLCAGGLEGVALVQVSITPRNNYRPVYYPTEYIVAISPSSPIGSYLTTLSARDPDVGLYGQLTYSIVPASGNGVGSFTVDPVTGETIAVFGVT